MSANTLVNTANTLMSS